ERSDRTDIRDPGTRYGAEAVRPRGQYAAHEIVADFGGGNVDDAHQHAAIDQPLHGLAAGTRGIEHKAVEFLFETGHDLRHAPRGYSEHGEADRRFALRIRRRVHGHPGYRMSGIAQHDAADTVQPRDIGNRVHHGDVAGPDELADIARGERRDHQLRQANWQRAHARGDDRSAPAAAEADDSGNVAAASNESGECLAHPFDCRAPVVAAEHELRAVRVKAGHFRCRDVHGDLRRSGADVYQDRRGACRVYQRLDVLQLLAFGISRADDVDALHGVRAERWRWGAAETARRA